MPRGQDLELLKASLPEDWKNVPILSYSQMMTADRCSFSWYLGYHLKLKSEKRKVALDTGSFVHALLHDMYESYMQEQMSSRDWAADRMPTVMMNLMDTDLKYEDQLASAANAMQIVERYAQTDVLAGHTPVGSEQHFFILVTTPSGRRFVLQGYIDLLTIDLRERIWIWDHKTGTKMWTPVQLMMDIQLPIYQVLLRTDGIPVHGLVINQLNSYHYKNGLADQPNEKLFKREFMSRSEPQLNSIWSEFMGLAEFVMDLMEGKTIARRSLRKDCSMCDMNVVCHDALSGTPLEVAAAEYNEGMVRVRSQIAGTGVELDLS